MQPQNKTDDVRMAARQYIKSGYRVVQLRTNSKLPMHDDWPEREVKSDQLLKEFSADSNIGLILGKASNHLVDIDLDCPEALEIGPALFASNQPCSFGRGGRITHFLFRCPGIATTKFTDEGGHMLLEIRSNTSEGEPGLQTMVPPSIHPETGKRLEFIHGGSGLVPSAEKDRLAKVAGLCAAACLIIRHWPEGGARHDTTLAIIGALLRSGIHDDRVEELFNIIVQHIPDEEKALRLRQFKDTIKRRDAGRPIRGLRWIKDNGVMPERAVDKIAEYLGLDIHRRDYDDFKDELYERHHVVNCGGDYGVMTRVYNPSLERSAWQISTFAALERRYINEIVSWTNPQTRRQNTGTLAAAFLRDPQRPTYEGVYLSPDRQIDGYLNLWRGFSVEPKPGSWARMQEHMRTNICRDNQELYDYLIGWMAFKVQHPDLVPGVALVLRGSRGVGKNVFADAYGGLFGAHYVLGDSPEAVMGRFTGHLRDCCLLVSDEAFWAGDKRHEGQLKSLITNQERASEKKGVDAEMVRNYIGLIILGNDRWVVPAAEDERRYTVFDVGSDHRQDHRYFRAIAEELDNGGREAMLHDLLQYDLSNFEVRRAPNSEGLFLQKMQNLAPWQQWWFQCLAEDRLVGGPADRYFGDEIYMSRTAYRAYIDWRNMLRVSGRIENKVEFGRLVRTYVNAPDEDKWKSSETYDKYSGDRGTGYKMPGINTLRHNWLLHFGGDSDSIDWSELSDNAERPDPSDMEDPDIFA